MPPGAPSCSRCRSLPRAPADPARAGRGVVLTAFGGDDADELRRDGLLLGKAIDVDPITVALASMAGLALGVATPDDRLPALALRARRAGRA